MNRLRSAIAISVLTVSACGTDDGNTNGDSSGAKPTAQTAQAIGSFTASQGYQGSGWTSETAEPRAAKSVSPHGRVRVWLNSIAITSQGGEPQRNSMAVKELYDDGDGVLGHAVSWRTGTADSDVLYYCVGPAGRCATGEPEHPAADPLLGTGSATACGICHGGNIFTEIQ